MVGSTSWVQDYYLKPVKISHGMVWFNHLDNVDKMYLDNE